MSAYVVSKSEILARSKHAFLNLLKDFPFFDMAIVVAQIIDAQYADKQDANCGAVLWHDNALA